MKHISIILLQVIQAIISFALPAAAVIGGYMIIAAFYLNAIEPGANIAFWLTAQNLFLSVLFMRTNFIGSLKLGNGERKVALFSSL